MHISIVSINYAPELTGIGIYSTGTAEFLAGRGHHVVVHTGFPYYPNWAKSPGDQKRLFRRESLNQVELYRSYLYVPTRPTAIKRMIHELSFSFSSALSYLLASRADVTLIVSPPLLLGLLIGLIARFKGSKVILHVQDLQPDAAVDLEILQPSLLTHVLFKVQSMSFQIADRVSSISRAMLLRIEAKGIPSQKTLLFKNWADSEILPTATEQTRFRELWELSGKFVLLYSGNLGVKQGLNSLLELASALRKDPEIVIVIVGDGGEKTSLIARAAESRLENVLFKDLVEKKDLPQLLALADVSLIPQKRGFTDIVLPSKLGNLLASHRPLIVAASKDSELGQIIETQRCGMLVEPEDTEAMERAVETLKLDAALRLQMADRGVRFAKEHLSREGILAGFETQLESLVSQPPSEGLRTGS
jgi:colanic acid biosynthesis glycosyl transferase WcaI